MIRRFFVKSLHDAKNFSRNLPLAKIYYRFWARGHSASWNVFTHLTPRERLLLYWLGFQQKQGANFLEIGSYLGASACFLAAAASELGGETSVHCVDTWLNEGMTEGIKDTFVEFNRNVCGYSNIIVPHRGKSVEIAQTFNDKLDLLFIDGDHSYAAVRNDLLDWLPKLKPNGMLVMHDYGWAEGVQRCVAEIIEPMCPSKEHIFENTYFATLR